MLCTKMQVMDLSPQEYFADIHKEEPYQYPFRETDADMYGMKFTIMTYEGAYLQTCELAAQIKASIVYPYLGCIVAAERGGVYIAHALAHPGIGGINLPVHTIKAKSYEGVEAEGSECEVMISNNTLPDKNFGIGLGIDDINDTSKTIRALSKALVPHYFNNLLFAVLNEKGQRATRRSDFCVDRTVSNWLVHPWEMYKGPLHLAGEVFAERGPHYALRDNGGSLEISTLSEVLNYFRGLGFHEREIPDVQDPGFLNNFIHHLRCRMVYLKRKGVQICDEAALVAKILG